MISAIGVRPCRQDVEMRWVRRAIEVLLRPYKAVPTPSAEPTPEADEWNRLVDEGWVCRWRPAAHHRRREWFWVRRSGHELVVFPGSETRPRQGGDPHFRLNGHLVYRSFGHPDGPSSVPWLVTRRGSVYPGEGYPGGPSGGPLYRVEPMRLKGAPLRVRFVSARDRRRGDSS